MCKFCKTKPVYEFTNKRTLCGSCFLTYFKRKVFHTTRKFKMFEQGEKVFFQNKNTLNDVVLDDVLKLYSGRGIIEIVKSKKVSKKVISSNIDSESEEIIQTLFKDKQKKFEFALPVMDNIVKPLYLFTTKEILLYAKLRKLKFKKDSKKENNIVKFVNNLEEKHPEIKRAIINSYLELFN